MRVLKSQNVLVIVLYHSQRRHSCGIWEKLYIIFNHTLGMILTTLSELYLSRKANKFTSICFLPVSLLINSEGKGDFQHMSPEVD